MLSTSLKKKFVNDMSLPISVLEEPHFSYLVELYDQQFDSVRKFEIFSDLISRIKEENFSELSRSVCDRAIEFVSKRPAFDAFSNSTLSKDQLAMVNSIKSKAKRKELYKRDNAGVNYVSIDMASANYQSMYLFDSDIFDGAVSFNDLLSKFTNEEYFLMSKKIRQVILGHLNPKKTKQYTQFLTASICKELLDLGIPEDDFMVISNDELIFINDNDKYRHIFESYCENTSFNLHLEFFSLDLVHPDRSFYSKTFEDGSFTLKCVPSKNYPEVLKYRLGKEIDTELDLAFDDDGRLSYFSEPILK